VTADGHGFSIRERQRKGCGIFDLAIFGKLQYVALLRASDAFPKNASRTAAATSHWAALSGCSAC
jgi:hypothetical protein